MLKTIKVKESYKKDFIKTIKSLNKKLQKYGVQIVINSVEEAFEEFSFKVGAEWRSYMIKVLNYTLEVPLTNGKSGVTFLGTYSNRTGVPQIYSENENFKLFESFKESGICDHCNTRRKRKVWHFFEENGQIKQIGSSCVQEYFGLQLEQIINTFEAVMVQFDGPDSDESEWDDSMHGFSGYSYMNLNALIATLDELSLGFTKSWSKGTDGYVKQIKDFYVGYSLRTLPLVELDRNKKSFESRKEQIQKQWPASMTPSSDFEFNILSVLYSDGKLNEYLSERNIGIAAWAIWKALSVENKKEMSQIEEKPNEYLGKVGDRITISGKIMIASIFDGMYGTTYLYLIETDKGVAKWFSSKCIADDMVENLEENNDKLRDLICKLKTDGLDVTLKGTIKSLEIYGNINQTVMTRCKVQS